MKNIEQRITSLERKVGKAGEEDEWEICDPKKEFESFIYFLEEMKAKAEGVEVTHEPLKYPDDYPASALRPPYKLRRRSKAEYARLTDLLDESSNSRKQHLHLVP